VAQHPCLSHRAANPFRQPFNLGYYFLNGTGTFEVYDADVTTVNGYHGGAYQEAISALSIGSTSTPCSV
jgi:hypothetical protein